MMTNKREELLDALTVADAEYQKLLGQCAALEEAYVRILHSLQPEDQRILERYIALCEELEYRRTRIALEISKAALE